MGQLLWVWIAALLCIVAAEEGIVGEALSKLDVRTSPPNDIACNAINIPWPSGNRTVTMPWNNHGASTEIGETDLPASNNYPGTNCFASPYSQDGWCIESTPYYTVWYKVTAPIDAQRMSIRSTGGDAKLAVYTTTDCTDFTQYVQTTPDYANDDVSSSSTNPLVSRVDVVAGQVYYVQVSSDGTPPKEIDGILTFTLTSDEICQAEPVVPVGLEVVTLQFDNEFGDTQPGELIPPAGTNGPTSCTSTDGWCVDDPNIYRTLWYFFIGPPTGFVGIAAFGPDQATDTRIAVYEGNGCQFANISLVAANDDVNSTDRGSLLSLVPVVPGKTYYIQVDGTNRTNGLPDDPFHFANIPVGFLSVDFCPNPPSETYTYIDTHPYLPKDDLLHVIVVLRDDLDEPLLGWEDFINLTVHTPTGDVLVATFEKVLGHGRYLFNYQPSGSGIHTYTITTCEGDVEFDVSRGIQQTEVCETYSTSGWKLICYRDLYEQFFLASPHNLVHTHTDLVPGTWVGHIQINAYLNCECNLAYKILPED